MLGVAEGQDGVPTIFVDLSTENAIKGVLFFLNEKV